MLRFYGISLYYLQAIHGTACDTDLVYKAGFADAFVIDSVATFTEESKTACTIRCVYFKDDFFGKVVLLLNWSDKPCDI